MHERKTNKFKRILLIIVLGIFIAAVPLAVYILHNLREDCRRISCASNLRSLGLALRQYAMDFEGYFPDKNGDAGLDMLRRNEYCTGICAYICPSAECDSAKGIQVFRPSYGYKGGLKAAPEYSHVPLMWDKCGNHKNYCNILFCDGHVEAVTFKNYRTFYRPGSGDKDVPGTVCPNLPVEILRDLQK